MSRSNVSKQPDLSEIKFDIDELQRCKLPKTCYRTCELVEGPNAGSYRRVGFFGGGDNIQSQGIGRFTGSHPLYPSQPWLGNAPGVVTSAGGLARFLDRSGGRNASESLSHEGYIYIPGAHVVEVDEIRFFALGQQFVQVRFGIDLNTPVTVGTLNYLNNPVNRQVGAPIPVDQDQVYGVLGYVLDRQDNADVQFQYRFQGGSWVNMPANWQYPNLADAQAAESLDTLWCVQGGIGTNEDDDRRLTEGEIQVLGVTSEMVDCPSDEPTGVIGIETVIRTEAHFGSSEDGTTVATTRNLEMRRTAAGQWQVRFPSPHPDGVAYFAGFTAHEEEANRDAPDITIVQGSKNANGFDLQITTGDNGTGADPYVDTPFDVKVNGPITVLTPSDAGGSTGPEPFAPLFPLANGKIVSDNFQDGNGNSPFNLQVRNTTNAAVDWQVCIPAAPYAAIPALNIPAGVNHDIIDNGDGTFRHCFDGTGLGAFANVTITGGLPVPAGVGGTGNLELYCE